MTFYLNVTPKVEGTRLATPKEIFKTLGYSSECIASQPSGSRDILYEITCPSEAVRDLIVTTVSNTFTCSLKTLAEAEALAESYTATSWGQSGEHILPQSIINLTDNIPSWSAVETAVNNIDTLAKARAYLLKLSRVVYDLAKGGSQT